MLTNHPRIRLGIYLVGLGVGSGDLACRKQIAHRRGAALKLHTLVLGREKAAGPVRRAAVGAAAAVGKHDKRRQ